MGVYARVLSRILYVWAVLMGIDSFSSRIDFADLRPEIVRPYSENRGIFPINLLICCKFFVERMWFA